MNVERSCTAVLMLQCQQLHRVCRGALFEGGEVSAPKRRLQFAGTNNNSVPHWGLCGCERTFVRLIFARRAWKEVRGNWSCVPQRVGPALFQSCTQCECGEAARWDCPFLMELRRACCRGSSFPLCKSKVRLHGLHLPSWGWNKVLSSVLARMLFPGPRHYPY